MKRNAHVRFDDRVRLTDAWRYLHWVQRKVLRIRFERSLWRHRLALPRPVGFSLLAVVGMFGLLAFLPHHPMSLVIAPGGGLSFALILKGR